MHDYFDLLGLSDGARASEIRRRSASRPRRWHPDFGGGARLKPGLVDAPLRSDAAVDFLNIAGVIDRMQQAFFAEL